MWIDACFARPPRMPGSSGTGVENILDDTVSSKRFQETRRADVHNAARPRNARFVALGNIMFPRLCALLLSLAAISAPAYSALDVDISVAAKTAMQMGSGVECCLFSEGAVASDGKVVMAPFMGGEIGVFDPSDDTLTYFSAGDAGSGYPHSPGCKLAFTIPNDGRVIMGPCVKGVGVWDPSDSTFTFTTPTNWPYIYGQVNHDFGGLAVMDDGRALLVPDNRHAMLGIFDPSANPADSLTLIDISGPDGVDHPFGGFRKAVRAANGKMVMCPAHWRDPTKVCIFDPSDDTYSCIANPDGIRYASTVAMPDGRVLCLPASDPMRAAVVDVETNTVSAVFLPSTLTCTGTGGMCYNDDAMTSPMAPFIEGISTPDGRIFLQPSAANQLALFDPETDTFTLIDHQLTFPSSMDPHLGKYFNHKPPALMANRTIVMIPNQVGVIGVFDLATDTLDTLLPGSMAQGEYLHGGAFSKAVTLNDGRVFLVPWGPYDTDPSTAALEAGYFAGIVYRASCDLAPPENGNLGSCSTTLPVGSTCSFACDDGYEVTADIECGQGGFVAATCLKPLVPLTCCERNMMLYGFEIGRDNYPSDL